MKKITSLFLMLLACIATMSAQVTSEVTINATTNTGTNTTSAWNFNDGYSITNASSKGYSTGNESTLKFSRNVTFTMVLPSNISVSGISITGYDNYNDVNAYLYELNGTTYSTTDYVFTRKDVTGIDSTSTSVGTPIICSHSITPASPITGSFTFQFKGQQVAVSFILTVYDTITGVESVINVSNAPVNVYSIEGRLIKQNVLRSEIMNELENGIYIINREKVVINRVR